MGRIPNLRKRGKVWHCYAKVNGHVRQQSTGCAKLNDAVAFRDNWLATVRRASPAKGGALSFQALADRFETEVMRHQKSYRCEVYRLNRLRNDLWDLAAGEVTADVIRDMRSIYTTPSSRNRYTTLTYAVLKFGAERHLIPRAVYDAARQAGIEPERNQRVRYLTDDEEARLLAVADARIVPLIRLAVLTGMRWGEMAALEWSHADLSNRVIRLPDSKSGRPRCIWLNDEACTILAEAQWARERLIEHTHNWLHKLFRKACTAAGLRDIRWHDLRHTFASRLAMQGATERELMELLGHHSTAMVQRYVHLRPGHLNDLVAKLGCQSSKTSH